MLKRLCINNLAIISNIDSTFEDGFSVLTGETGAGKSLVIDSLSLLLGSRASTELIRKGEEKAIVKGYFEVNKPQLEALFLKLNIPYNQGEIEIERVIGRNKNYIKVNNTPTSLIDLSKIAPYLADIHSQFDFEKILNEDNYLGIIDGFSFDLVSSYKEKYQVALNQYKVAKEAYSSLLDKQKQIDSNYDFYLYQYNELKQMDLKEGEEKQIQEEISLLENFDKIHSLQEETKQLLNGDFLDKFFELDNNLEKLSSYQEKYKEAYLLIDERYLELNDYLSSLKKKFDDIDYDPARLDELNQRQVDIIALKRKYKKDFNELLAYKDELSLLLENKDNLSNEINKKKEEMDKLFLLTLEKGKELSKIRQSLSNKIEKELERSLNDLLLKAKFKIMFAPTEKEDDSIFLESGIDKIDFLIETNVGEGLKSLSKIISGGEASRIMLAFKSLFIKANKVPTVIFDEIDTGISGETAQAVARKIKEISLSTQVISITHMPQVASLSDHHILISKIIKDGRTYAKMKELNLEEKIKQVAYLISGDKITPSQLEYAKEMVLGSN
ncbi:MAG: DNA repair protein RecN [Mollicutes bacterium]|nr:DNA repair protein RecN [Mollicutes bacterium]